MKKPPGPPLTEGSFAEMFESGPKAVGVRHVKVGDALDLEVVRIGDTGVLVALDGKREGVVELSELTDDHGKPTVRVGSRVAVRVVDIDRTTGQVRLSPISTQPIVASLSDATAKSAAGAVVVPGMRVRGKVTAVERYGVFIEFPVPGESRPKRGLVPTAELGAPRGADLRKNFPIGTELEAAVAGTDERGRVRLSVVALAAAEERKEFESYASQGKQEDKSKPKPERQQGFGTLGDLLKGRK